MISRVVRWFVVAVLGCLPVGSEAAERPNFIVINVDDLGYADIGPFGSKNSTPNLDRLAREGRKLTSHYAAPSCSPSRAALMTGCYPKRVLPIPGVLFPAAAVGLHPEEVTVAEVLKDAGYATACIGKWHLGDQAEFLPTSQGFDEYFGIPYSNDMGLAAEGSKSNPGKPLPPHRARPAGPASAQQLEGAEVGIRGNAQPPLPLVEGKTVVGRVRADDQFQLTRRYTERAVKFIEGHAAEPFFLYFPHTAVHFPHYPSDEFRGRSPNGLLGDWTQEVDWSVGQVLEALDRNKLNEKTLVLFTSDNGGPLNQGAKNTPLRGGKGQTWEGGVRVCTLARWTGKIPAGSSTSAMTSMMDVLPTFAALADAKLPTGRKLDGVNVWDALTGDAAPRTEFLYYRGFQLEAVRSGPWKLHLPRPDEAKKNGARGELYHLDDDIGEQRDVAAKHPEVVERLTKLAAAQESDLGTIAIGDGCRRLGRAEAPLPMILHDGTVRADAVGPAKRFP